ncbi:flagellar motor protein MotB [Helicobacter sp. 13S00401-1]|uniref:flagellar motor protein MotB n=1 Tax=Helicobacter sp. 13S00401-1 TaxID=1905758 RepID=UPI000BA535EA|nr:flagellar motor protein MotB [Helicobacter sp. 13S00401-1]PAF51420.1 flagellar motor protein MotB [Helicobacter sp. 13S00401-1]
MARKKKKTECPMGEKWAVPYADFLSLLLALFIALYAISATNTEKVKALKTEFIKIFDFAPKPESAQPVIITPQSSGHVTNRTDSTRVTKTDKLNTSVNYVSITQLSNLIQDGGLLEQMEKGIVLRLPSDILFMPDSAKLIDSDRQTELKLLGSLIAKFPKEVQINVRGYTDDSPLKTFSNHYELASKRAYNVMEYLISEGVDPRQLSYTSYGKYHPILPNNSDVNRNANNRVEIYFSTSRDAVNEVKGILDTHSSNQH